MRDWSRLSLRAAGLLLMMLVAASGLASQGQDAAPAKQGNAAQAAADPGAAMVIRGKAFSAIRYARVVEKRADGKSYFVRNLRFPTHIGRDSQRRIYMQTIEARSECDHLELHTPPPCPSWSLLMFDPAAAMMTHWGGGEVAGHIYIDLRMTADQVQQAIEASSNMPGSDPGTVPDGATVTTTDLGSKSIEGISATGTRVTTRVSAEHAGTKEPVVSTHEVWISKEMDLVVKAIDIDARGQERVAGLEHVTLSPDASLLPPGDYEHQDAQKNGFAVGQSIDRDMAAIEDWFVGKSPANP